MKRMMIILTLAALMIPAAVQAQSLVREYHDSGPTDLNIDVWVDNEDGIYYVGEEVRIYFQANYDCYAVIYGVDTRGEVHILFPEDPWEDGRIDGGETYSIPGRNADYDLVVSGPEGIEHLQAVASTQRMEIPNWYEGDAPYMDDREDPEDFIEDLNYRYFECRWDDCAKAYDHTSIYVKSATYYYKPVYVPQPWYTGPDYTMIYIDYPYGGEVYIDGVFIGIAPLYIPRILLGWHWFTIYDRYGYCWEHHYHIRYHDRPYFFDHSIVNTSRSKVSRYTDLRTQVKTYRKSDYVLSDQRVKTSRTTSPTGVRQQVDKFSRPGTTTKYDKDYTTKSSDRYKTGSATKQSDGSATKRSSSDDSKRSTNKWNSWSTKKSGSSKSSGNSEEYRTTKQSSGSQRSTGSKSTFKRSSGSTTKESSGSQRTVKQGSSSSPSSSGKSTIDNGGSSTKSGSTSQSSGGYKSSGGSSSKSSGGSTKSSGGGASKSSSSSSKSGGGSKSRSGGRN
ncbi:MAG: DUF4384 domain-containing protein [Candidatus Zixiibacteriota bacterium]